MKLAGRMMALAVAALVLSAGVALAQTGAQPAPKDQGTTPALKQLPKAADAAQPVAQRNAGFLDHSAILPEGKTLPEKAMRVRFPFRFMSGTYGYDADGNKTEMGLGLHATAGGFVLEYGVTDKMTVQLLAPVIYRNELSLSKDEFRSTDVYKAQRDKMVYAAAATIMQGIAKGQIPAAAFPSCTSVPACMAWIAGGGAPAANIPVPLPTGETLLLTQGVPVMQTIDSFVTGAAKQADGKTGLGDVQIGFLYEVFRSDPIMFSVGVGLRMPTGSFENVGDAQRPTGRGTTDLGVRWNFDYAITRNAIFSWQNQSEVMLKGGKKKKSSLLDPEQTNEEDPTTPTALAMGSNGEDNDQTFVRKGLRNVGFTRVGYTLGGLTQSLKAFGTYAELGYDFDGEERLDDTAKKGKMQSKDARFALTISGLDYQVPMSMEVVYSSPLKGENQSIAYKYIDATIKAYYRF